MLATTWFETRGATALFTMRNSGLILRSPPQAGVSKDGYSALLPRPACGERVGVRGTLDGVGLAESPPHPLALLATSPRTRGEVYRIRAGTAGIR